MRVCSYVVFISVASSVANGFKFMSSWKLPNLEEKMREQEQKDQFGDKSTCGFIWCVSDSILPSAKPHRILTNAIVFVFFFFNYRTCCDYWRIIRAWPQDYCGTAPEWAIPCDWSCEGSR